jgi:N-acetylglucosaminyl-diphospho-decaprenol L-rhamnosyltransferase
MYSESNPKLSIVIVNYNTKNLLLQCLSSVFRETVETDFEIIVVDNNSRDNSATEVKAKFPHIKVIANQTNLGFARANNQALRLMRGQYGLLLNPDTVVLDNALDKMVKFMEDHKLTGVLGCRILSDHGTLQRAAYPPPSLWISITSMLSVGRLAPGRADQYYRRHLERLFPAHLTNRYYDRKCKIAQRPFRVGWVSGACLLIRRSAVEDIGFMDENLFLFGEDADWCCRARQKGWGIMTLPEAQITHFGGMSTSDALSISIGAGQHSRLYFAKKHFGPASVFILKCLSFIALLAKYVIIRLKPGVKSEERRSRLKGYRRGFRIIFGRIK